MRTFSLLLFLVIRLLSSGAAAAETALDRYVAKPDDQYSFQRYHTERKALYTTYFLRMTSQQWRTPDEVDRPVWTHDLMITVPRLLSRSSPRTAVLIIDGGSNDGPAPRDTNAQAANVAVALGRPVVLLKQVPNQPLVFSDESPNGRSENGIIAYSFNQFLGGGDEEWPALLPMTKAAVRAMDTAQTALARRSIRIRNFIVYGGSKRGWAAWLTAAVDKRVRAVIPASIDLLHLAPQNQHHCEAYGFYSDAMRDFVAFDLPNRTQTPEGAALAAIVDPYEYRDRYKMAKFILNSTGDQYYPPDSSQFYFADLPRRKWMRYTPNTDHAQNTAAFLSAVAWAKKVLNGEARPQFRWSFDSLDGAIRLRAVTPPSQVRLWQATNPNARDFRLPTIGPSWTSSPLFDLGGGLYIGHVNPPTSGWTAYFVELTYASSSVLEPPQVYTTDVQITPDFLPYAGAHCQGEFP